VRAHLEKPACLRIDPRAPLTIAALWSGEFSEPAATFLGDIKKSRHPTGSLTLASAQLIGFVFEHRFNLIPKLWAILVSMR
jgi:hypothetical protein